MKIRTLGYCAIVAVTAVAFALGSAAPSEAKGKKKAEAAPAPMPQSCMLAPAGQVCGTRGGMKFSYFSACYAAQDGAKVVSQGACKPAKMAMAGKKKMSKKKM